MVFPSMDQRGQDGIQNMVQSLARIFRQKTQDKIFVLLEQGVLPAVAPVGIRAAEVLRSVEFDSVADATRPSSLRSSEWKIHAQLEQMPKLALFFPR